MSAEALMAIRLPAIFPEAEVSAPPEFPRSAIHIWRLPLNSAHMPMQALWSLLDQEEQSRAERFHFESDRLRFVTAHGLVRCVLGWYLREPPQCLRFTYGPRGKPALAARCASDMCFNLSHTSDVALLGLARQREIGIDIELVRPGLAQDRIAERFFAPAEARELRAIPVADQDEAFFACWTRKEAYIKARGDGLTLALDQFQVSLAPGEPPRLVRGYESGREAQRWSMHDLGLRPNYCAALVVEGTAGIDTLRWFAPEVGRAGRDPRHVHAWYTSTE